MTSNILRNNYFISSLFGAIWMLFIPIYLTNGVNLSFTELGIIMFWASVFGTFGPIIIGLLIDYFHKESIFIWLLIVATAIILMFLLPNVTGFTDTLIVVVCFVFLSNAIGPTLDRITNEYAKVNNLSYGTIRIFGSIGFVILAFLIPLITTSEDTVRLMVIIGTIAICLSFLSLKLPNQKSTIESGNSFFTELKVLFKNKSYVLIVIFSALIIGMTLTTSFAFTSTYLEETDSINLLPWAILFSSGIAEIWTWVNYRKLAIKYTGIKVLIFSMLALLLRFIICYFTTNPIIFVFSMLLHGFAVAAITNYILDLVIDTTEKNVHTTAVAFNFAIAGCATGISSSILGVILENFAINSMFIYFSIIICISLGFLYVINKQKALKGARY